MSKKSSLGRGLSALISDDLVGNEIEDNLEVKDISLELIRANKFQPRKKFEKEKLEELSRSISKHGVIQPIILREIEDASYKYEIVAGERRYRASKLAGKKEVASIILDLDDKESAKMALIENVQREDLDPIEEARGYKSLIENYELSQKDLSEAMGKSRSYISNSIRLLKLDENTLERLSKEEISVGHGKVLLGLEDEKKRLEVLSKILEEKLSVRETEELLEKLRKKTESELEVKETKKNKDKHNFKEKAFADSYLRDIEDRFMEILGTKVKIIEGNNKNTLEIEYYSEEDLDRIYEIINK